VLILATTTVRCENCGGTDWVSLAVAGVALIVSFASLYLASLRRADIDCDLVTQGSRLGDGGFMNEHPDEKALTVCVFMSNSGAHGAVVEGVALGGFRYIGTEPALWQGIGPPHEVFPTANPYGPQRPFPIVLEAGEGETMFLRAALVAYPARGGGADFARAVAGLEAVELTVTWTFTRSATPLSKATRRRRTERREQKVRLDGSDFRESARRFWRENPAYEPLARAMEPATPAAPDQPASPDAPDQHE
jgi:hypothetical protein